MATVANTIKLPDGTTPSYAAVVIELVASTTSRAAGWITASDTTILSVARPTVTAGAWTASLTPNADITPSGTVYKVTETADKVRYIHYIEVGSGGGSVFDLLVDPPATLASAALSAHIADTSGAHAASAISVSDSGGYYAGADVETVLADVGGRTVRRGIDQQLVPTGLRRARAAIAAAAAGVSDCRIAWMGDSTSVGVGGTNHSKSPAAALTRLLQGRGLPAYNDGVFGTHNTSTWDSRVTYGGSWVQSFWYTGRGFQIASLAAGTLTFTPADQFDRIRFFYATSTSSGEFTVDIGAGTIATINADTTLGFTSQTVSVAAGSYTISCGHLNTKDQVFLKGIETTLSTSPRIHVATLGRSGALAVNFTDPTSSAIGDYPFLTEYAPDLAILTLTINDSNAGTSVATYETQIEELLTHLDGVGCDVLFCVPPGSSPQPANYSSYLSVVRNAGVPVLELQDRWGVYADANAAGLMSDTLHPGSAGNADWAQAVVEALRL